MGNYNECGIYRDYYQMFSHDFGSTWTVGKPVSGMGCVNPNLLQLRSPSGRPSAHSPLLLTGGRWCTGRTSDLFLWLNRDGMAGLGGNFSNGSAWTRLSLSYIHNTLWRRSGGDPAYLFDERINSSRPFLAQSQDYTSLVQLSPTEALVSYNKYFHPSDGFPGCYMDGKGGQSEEVCASAFVMRVSIHSSSRNVSTMLPA